MRTQCMGRHVQGQPRWQQTTCAAPHVYTRDTLLGSPQPTLQRVPVSCGCVFPRSHPAWFAALCVHRGIACGPVPVPVPFPLCCERLTFGNETLGTGSGTCSRSRSVPVFFLGNDEHWSLIMNECALLERGTWTRNAQLRTAQHTEERRDDELSERCSNGRGRAQGHHTASHTREVCPVRECRAGNKCPGHRCRR